MSGEIELVSDGEGVAVIGAKADVDRFLKSANVESRELALNAKVSKTLQAGSGVLQAASEVAANSGRWVKLTEDSAKAMKLGQMMKGSTDGVSRLIVTHQGKTTKIMEFIDPKAVGAILTNPAMLAGAAGIMAQIAMQQQMDEITAYLKSIDEKVDDVLRAQKDAQIAPVLAADSLIKGAIEVREKTGRVSDVTWSKVQACEQKLVEAQMYALRQLDAMAAKFEKKEGIAELAKASEKAAEESAEWLALIAYSFQLQDALSIIELGRVFDSDPDELESHRIGLLSARSKRREQISKSTNGMPGRIDKAVSLANKKVLFNPIQSPAIVKSANSVAHDVLVFNETLGIAVDQDDWQARAWMNAAEEVRDKAAEIAVDSAEVVAKFSVKTFEDGKHLAGKAAVAVSDVVSEQLAKLEAKKNAKKAAASKTEKKPAAKKTAAKKPAAKKRVAKKTSPSAKAPAKKPKK